MKIKDYMDCTLPQRTLIDEITYQERQGNKYKTKNGNEMKTVRSLAAKGFVEMKIIFDSGYSQYIVTLV
jgi:hypothetical protein